MFSASIALITACLVAASVFPSCAALNKLKERQQNCPFSCATVGCQGSNLSPRINIPIVAFEDTKHPDSILSIYVRFHFKSDLYDEQQMSEKVFNMLLDANKLFGGLIHFSLPNDGLFYSIDLEADRTIEYFNFDLDRLHQLDALAEVELINVFVLPSESILNGFTMLPADWMDFEDTRWNSIFLASDVDRRNTLGHELGHFFGLNHIQVDGAASNCDAVNDNIMSYQTCRNKFTSAQLDTIVGVLVNTRDYLIQ